MQKQIFQAGLEDMHILQFDACSGSETCHLRNERTAAVGVNIRAGAVGCAHFAHAGKTLQALEEFRRVQAKAQTQEKTSGDGSL